MHTMDLLERAEKREGSLRSLARRLGMNCNALSKARSDGHLSAPTAAAVAIELDEDPRHWALVAASESKKNPPEITRRLHSALRRLLSTS